MAFSKPKRAELSNLIFAKLLGINRGDSQLHVSISLIINALASFQASVKNVSLNVNIIMLY